MKPKTTIYSLSLVELHHPFHRDGDVEHTTPLDSFESLSPFGSFNVGDGVAKDGLIFLGRIQHIHHGIGLYGEDQILHHTKLFLYRDRD